MEWWRQREEERRIEEERKVEEYRRAEALRRIEEVERRENQNIITQENEQEFNNDRETTFGFPILYTREILGEEIKMKNIPPSVLPNFYGMSTKDPDAFMFKFVISCRTRSASHRKFWCIHVRVWHLV